MDKKIQRTPESVNVWIDKIDEVISKDKEIEEGCRLWRATFDWVLCFKTLADFMLKNPGMDLESFPVPESIENPTNIEIYTWWVITLSAAASVQTKKGAQKEDKAFAQLSAHWLKKVFYQNAGLEVFDEKITKDFIVKSTGWARSLQRNPIEKEIYLMPESISSEKSKQISYLLLLEEACKDMTWIDDPKLKDFLIEKGSQFSGLGLKLINSSERILKCQRRAIVNWMKSVPNGMKLVMEKSGLKTPVINTLIMSFREDPELLLEALNIGEKQKMLGPEYTKGAWKGYHPLYVIKSFKNYRPNDLWSACIKKISQLGYKADWSLPEGFTDPVKKSALCEENFLLEWVKSHATCLMAVTEVSIEAKIDFNQRSKRGETAVGALNRIARCLPSEGAIKALECACDYGDILKLGTKKDPSVVGNTPAIRAFMATQIERKLLEEGVNGKLWEKCLAQAKEEHKEKERQKASSGKARL